jgi:hypothetical protein
MLKIASTPRNTQYLHQLQLLQITAGFALIRD